MHVKHTQVYWTIFTKELLLYNPPLWQAGQLHTISSHNCQNRFGTHKSRAASGIFASIVGSFVESW